MYARNEFAVNPGEARSRGVEVDMEGRSIWRRSVSRRVEKNRFEAYIIRSIQFYRRYSDEHPYLFVI